MEDKQKEHLSNSLSPPAPTFKKTSVTFVGAVVLGIILLHSYLWIKDLQASQLYELPTPLLTNVSININATLDESTTVKTVIYPVPNIVHYVWYQDQPVEFTFDRALSVLSAAKYLNPEAILFHTNQPPIGQYFEMLKNISIFKIVNREPPTKVIKQRYHETDYSDYDRVKVLQESGGIYLDLDVIIIKSFDTLREYDCTVGLELPSRICAGVIICKKDHPFLYMWLNSYYDDFKGEWAYNSAVVSSRLMQRYGHLVHVETNTMHTPNWQEVNKIWGSQKYNWTNNYALHTWIRVAQREGKIKANPTPESIKAMPTTYGEIARRVFYGSPDIIVK